LFGKKELAPTIHKIWFLLTTDYVLAFSKESATFALKGEIKDSSNYKNPDNDPRGAWAKDNLTCNKTASERPNLFIQ
jgi:adenine-specific DNA-methyltransferase